MHCRILLAYAAIKFLRGDFGFAYGHPGFYFILLFVILNKIKLAWQFANTKEIECTKIFTNEASHMKVS